MGEMEVVTARVIAALEGSGLPGIAEITAHLANAAAASASAGTDAAVAAAAAVEAAKAARASTFPYLASEMVPAAYNEAYALGSLLFAEALLLKARTGGGDGDDDGRVEAAKSALRAIDLAALRGGSGWMDTAEPLIRGATAIIEAALPPESAESADSASESLSGSTPTTPPPPRKRRRVNCVPAATVPSREDYEKGCPHWVDGGGSGVITAIGRVSANDLTPEAFATRYLAQSEPVIVTGAMTAWPAMGAAGEQNSWRNPNYLKRKAGDRLIPVEVYDAADSTQTYLTASWQQQVMKLADYIDDFVAAEEATAAGPLDHSGTGDAGVGDGDGKADGHGEDEGGAQRAYLAQYPLFDQIPSLRDDLETPGYCSKLLPSDVKAGEPDLADPTRLGQGAVQTSAWFGPAATVSPLHHDPYHNLLAQVVGYKYIRLYRKAESARVYPRTGPLCNNSELNLDDVDHAQFPKFGGTPGLQCVLAPGEMLHIPRHCWHYVRSLTLSFSVNFFWGAKLGE